MLKSSAQPSQSEQYYRLIHDWISQHPLKIWSGMCGIVLLIAVSGAVGLFSAGSLPEDQKPPQPIAVQPSQPEPLLDSPDSGFPLWGFVPLFLVCGAGAWMVTLGLKTAIAPPRKRPVKKRPQAKARPRPTAQPPRIAPPPPRRPANTLSFNVQRPPQRQPQRNLRPPLTAPRPRSLPPAPQPQQAEPAIVVVPAETAIALDRRQVSLAESLDLRKRHTLNSLMHDS
jgi:hypothetical protein